VRPIVDAGPTDAGTPPSADAGSAQTEDAGQGGSDAGTVETPIDGGPVEDLPRGVYSYERVAIGGLGDLVKVAFHPSGAYALVAQRSGALHVIDASSLTDTPVVFPGADTMRAEDVAFSASGERALIAGQRGGVAALFVFDHATAQDPAAGPAAALREIAVPAGTAVAAVADGWNGLFAALFRIQSGAGTSAVLRTFDPSTDAFALLASTPTAAGCTDLALVHNEFGGPGVLITCGINGYAGLFYTEVGGVPELRTGAALGSTDVGNTTYVAAHPSGDYALAVSWSSRRVRRFEGGVMNEAAQAPTFSTRPIWSAAFAPDGGRALVVGGVTVNGDATVIEYRHDLYACTSGLGASCDLSEVSVPGITAPPFSAPSDFNLNDAAFRPGCDGGFLVGGVTNFNTDIGMVIRFQLEPGVPCPGP
jgi:hypothetical protein